MLAWPDGSQINSLLNALHYRCNSLRFERCQRSEASWRMFRRISHPAGSPIPKLSRIDGMSNILNHIFKLAHSFQQPILSLLPHPFNDLPKRLRRPHPLRLPITHLLHRHQRPLRYDPVFRPFNPNSLLQLLDNLLPFTLTRPPVPEPSAVCERGNGGGDSSLVLFQSNIPRSLSRFLGRVCDCWRRSSGQLLLRNLPLSRFWAARLWSCSARRGTESRRSGLRLEW